MADWKGYYMPSVIVGIYACDLRYLLFKNHMEKNTNANLNLGLLFQMYFLFRKIVSKNVLIRSFILIMPYIFQ